MLRLLRTGVEGCKKAKRANFSWHFVHQRLRLLIRLIMIPSVQRTSS